MAIVTTGLTELNMKIAARPRGCLHCGSTLLQGWRTVAKPVRDPQLRAVQLRRFQCCDCNYTFSHYPKGVD